MSLIETLTSWDHAVQSYDRGDFSEALGKLEEIAEPSSKILFNMGRIQLARELYHESLQHLDACVMKDQHLAIGFFLRGIVLYHMDRFEESLNNFQQCITCLRGKDVIDYKQLGLCHKLYSCEVLQNLAVLKCKFHDFSGAVDCLCEAEKCQAEPKHSHENRTLESLQAGHTIRLVNLPKTAIFKPAKSKTSNMAKKNYLGTAKVISSVKENDDFSGFIGPQKIVEDLMKSRSAPNSPLLRRSAPPNAALTFLKGSLTPSPKRKISSPAAPGHFSLPNNHQMSPLQYLASKVSEIPITLSPPNDSNNAAKPPPPSRPVPRLPGNNRSNGDMNSSISSKEINHSIIEEILRKNQTQENLISQTVSPPKRSPPVLRKYSSDYTRTENISVNSVDTTRSNSNSISKLTDSSRPIPPPPSKPLPIPPVPSRELRKQRAEAADSLHTHTNNNSDQQPPLPQRSLTDRLNGKPTLSDYKAAIEDKKLKKLEGELHVNVEFHCHHSVNVTLRRGLSLNKLICEACKLFQLNQDSIDLWWQINEDSDLNKIQNEDEMQRIWATSSTQKSLSLWCFGK